MEYPIILPFDGDPALSSLSEPPLLWQMTFCRIEAPTLGNECLDPTIT